MYKRRSKPAPRRRHPLLMAGVVVLIAAGVIGGYALLHHKKPADQQVSVRPQNTVNYSPPTPEEKAEAEQQKSAIISKNEDNSNTSGTPSTPTSDSLHVSIIRASQNGAGTPVNVRAVISGTQSGTCLVTFTKSGQATVSKSFPIAFEATSASCQGADVAAADFPAGGDWTLSVTAQTTSATSAAATQTVTIAK